LVFRPADGALLVIRGYDPVTQQRFFLLPGGGVEFGESALAAARREFLEEFGEPLADVRPLGTLENFFTFRGQPGHEIVFVFKADLQPSSLLPSRVEIAFNEAEESLTAEWRSPDLFGSQALPRPPLYPDGVLALIQQKGDRPCPTASK
jgi:8-oxo-dGTP pyrophosphatase MutT (NUDIX family)